MVILKQAGEKLSGTYAGRYGTEPLTGTVTGDDIVFELNMNAEGQSLKVVYKGRVQNAGNMKGEVEFGEFGNGTWTGVKK